MTCQRVSVACQRGAETPEALVLQLTEAGHQSGLSEEVLLVLRNHFGVVAVVSEDERVALWRLSADDRRRLPHRTPSVRCAVLYEGLFLFGWVPFGDTVVRSLDRSRYGSRVGLADQCTYWHPGFYSMLPRSSAGHRLPGCRNGSAIEASPSIAIQAVSLWRTGVIADGVTPRVAGVINTY